MDTQTTSEQRADNQELTETISCLEPMHDKDKKSRTGTKMTKIRGDKGAKLEQDKLES